MAVVYCLRISAPATATTASSNRINLEGITLSWSAVEALADLATLALHEGSLALDYMVVPVAVADSSLKDEGDGTFRANWGIEGTPLSIAEVLGEGGAEVVAWLKQLDRTTMVGRGGRAAQLAWQEYLTNLSAISGTNLLATPFPSAKDYEQALDKMLRELSGDREDIFRVRAALLDTACCIVMRRLFARNPELCGDAGVTLVAAMAAEALAPMGEQVMGDFAFQTLRHGGLPLVFTRWLDDLRHVVLTPLAMECRRFARVPAVFAPHSTGRLTSFLAETKRMLLDIGESIRKWRWRVV